MRRASISVVVLPLALLAGCGGGSDQADDQPQPADTGSAAEAPISDAGAALLAKAPAAFGQCASCHSLEKGQNGIGPSLVGVYGTKAGDIPGYAFSPALKASGLTWDDATLDKWLSGPMQLVPGTKMTYGGQADPAKRKALIEFLKTLK